MTGDAEGDRDGRGARRSAVLGAALALPVLAAVVVGSGAARPPATSDGVWTTPLQVVLGLAGFGVLVVLVVALRSMEVDGVRPGPSRRRSRALVLFALLVVAIVAVPRLDLEPPLGDVSPFSFAPSGGGAGAGAEPLPVSPTAVVAGLAALALAVAGGVFLLRAGSGQAALHRDDSGPGPAAAAPAVELPPDGPPVEVVLTAYAAARDEVVRRLGAGEHDPPGRLLRRATATPMAAPLQVLTALYLPVRYGRGTATESDAAAAVAALGSLRAASPTASPVARGRT